MKQYNTINNNRWYAKDKLRSPYGNHVWLIPSILGAHVFKRQELCIYPRAEDEERHRRGHEDGRPHGTAQHSSDEKTLTPAGVTHQRQ